MTWFCSPGLQITVVRATSFPEEQPDASDGGLHQFIETATGGRYAGWIKYIKSAS